MNELITAIRRYLGDRDPGQTGGDIADVWAAIEQAEAAMAAERGPVTPRYRTVVLVQPQGSGKSEVTAEQFGCRGIIDEWDDSKTLFSGYLHLTNVMPGPLPGFMEVVVSQPQSPNQATA